MYSIQALWSAAQLELPIAFVILKNRRYAALQDFAPAFGFGADERLPGTELPDIDFVALARGQGCAGLNVNRAENLRKALDDALHAGVPTLVEVDVA
jgi:benzoylformate decarboxylase